MSLGINVWQNDSQPRINISVTTICALTTLMVCIFAVAGRMYLAAMAAA